MVPVLLYLIDAQAKLRQFSTLVKFPVLHWKRINLPLISAIKSYLLLSPNGILIVILCSRNHNFIISSVIIPFYLLVNSIIITKTNRLVRGPGLEPGLRDYKSPRLPIDSTPHKKCVGRAVGVLHSFRSFVLNHAHPHWAVPVSGLYFLLGFYCLPTDTSILISTFTCENCRDQRGQLPTVR